MNGLNDIVGQDAKEAGRWFSRPNLFVNSDFRRPVNQMGQSEYPYSGYISVYTIDMWMITYGNVKVVKDKGVSISETHAATYNFYQVIDPEKVPTLSRTLTLSFLLDHVNTTSATLFVNDGTTIYRGTEKIHDGMNTLSCTIADNATYLHAGIATGEGAEFMAIAAKLEEGIGQTLAHKENGVWVQNRRPDPRLELLKCQSFYLPLSLNIDFAGVNWGTGMYFFVPTPVQMRANPILRPTQAAMVYHNGGATGVEISDFNTTTTSVSNGVQIFVKSKEEIPIGNCVLAELQGAFDARL